MRCFGVFEWTCMKLLVLGKQMIKISKVTYIPVFLFCITCTCINNICLLCPPEIDYRGHIVFASLSFCPPLWNFNLANNFWTMNARALIFHMNIPCDRPFRGYHYFWPCALTLEFDRFFENFNLAYNFWTVSAKALIFHMNIPCDKTFSWVPLFFTLWPWSWSLTQFLKTLTC